MKRSDGAQRDPVRAEAERRIGHQISDDHYQRLRRKGYGTLDGQDFETAVRDLVDGFQNFYGRQSIDRTNRKDTEEESEILSSATRARVWAVSRVHAVYARLDSKVVRFRESWLGGVLNSSPDQDQTVRASVEWAKSQGADDAALSALFHEEHPQDFPKYVRDMMEPPSMPPILAALSALGDELAITFDWSKRQATHFVLTGTVPVLRPIRATGRTHSIIGPDGELAVHRLVLVIDPLTPPDEVARYYQHMRREWFYEDQTRTPSEKVSELAAFFGTVEPGEPTLDILRRWNELVREEWRYDPNKSSTVSNFKRDLKNAFQQVIYPKFKQ